MKDDQLITFNNYNYYIDIDEISNYIRTNIDDIVTPKTKNKVNRDTIELSNMVNITKYEMIKLMVEVVLNMGFSMTDMTDMDDMEKLVKGVNNDSFDQMPTPFKLAFNTLIINNIIKNYEPANRKNKRNDSETKK